MREASCGSSRLSGGGHRRRSRRSRRCCDLRCCRQRATRCAEDLPGRVRSGEPIAVSRAYRYMPALVHRAARVRLQGPSDRSSRLGVRRNGGPRGAARPHQSLVKRADRAVASLPLRGRQTGYPGKIQERRRIVDQALEYVQLYGAYGRCEAQYEIDNTQALWERLDDADRAAFAFRT